MAEPQVEVPPSDPVPSADPSKPSTQPISDKDRLDYYWKHFALIADQRVKTFNFYVVVVAATLVATIGALKPNTPRLTLCLIGLGHIFCVVIFWMIESRGRAIVRIANTALQEFERSPAFGDGYKPMTEESKKTSRGKWGLVTYGTAFRLVFAVHILFGAVIAFWPSLILPKRASQASSFSPQPSPPLVDDKGQTTMQNVLFYTFSTIAATFGSAVGIIVAAAIFRIQRMDQIAAGLANELLKYHPNDMMASPPHAEETQISRLNRIIVVQHWNKYFDVWKQYHQGNVPQENYWEQHIIDLLGKVIARQGKIRRDVRRLVIATLVLIGACFLQLGTTQAIDGWQTESIRGCKLGFNLPCAITLLFAFIILIYYGRVTRLLLSEAADYAAID